MHTTFIVYSSGRSGSTTLLNILNTHEPLTCLNEPFNPDHHPPFNVTEVSDFKLIHSHLQTWLADYTGIKHVWDPEGWPFVNRPEFNQRLLLEFDRVIFLNRRNVLQRVVSSQLSLHSQVWHIRSQADKETHEQYPFRDLDLAVIERHLEKEKKILSDYHAFFKAHKVAYIELWYEELFSTQVSFPEKISLINTLFTFLGFHQMDSKTILPQVRKYLSPTLKQNDQALYLKVSNIDQVEKCFGSDQNGWLFQE